MVTKYFRREQSFLAESQRHFFDEDGNGGHHHRCAARSPFLYYNNVLVTGNWRGQRRTRTRRD